MTMAYSAAHIDLAWFTKATVHQPCTGIFDEDTAFDWRFPVEMKPLLGHPAMLAQPQSTQRFIHAQAFHKYLHDVCLTETDVVNRVAVDIAYGRSIRVFEAETATEALAILVDEAFHSYMARLFSNKVSLATGIAPIPMPARNALINAYEDIAHDLDDSSAALSRFLCCCLSESTFTKEILVASRLDGYDPGFRRLMEYHLADEGRHYGYFRRALAWVWPRLDESEREMAATLLPAIIATYFDDFDDRTHDRAVLLAAGIDSSMADKMLNDIARQRPALSEAPRLQNSLEFLRLTKVSEHALVRKELIANGLMTP